MNTERTRRATGELGEELGGAYLKERGYKVLARNVRSPFGEIDLVARDGETLVFVEIKTRAGHAFGFPEEAVTQQKKERLIRLASWYLARHLEPKRAVRFDVLAIELSSGAPDIRLIQNAFEL